MGERRVRVLAAAFAPVPGANPQSAAMLAMLDALRGDLDLVTRKTEDLAHVKRIGNARMFRVPAGRGPNAAELYGRAVGRQLEAEPYDIVHVMDPWAGSAVAGKRRGASLVYEVTSFPEQDPDPAWVRAHTCTLEAAALILVPTAAAASALEAQGVSARVEVLRPSVDINALDWTEVPSFGAPRILVLGELGVARDLPTVIDALRRVAALRPVRVLLAGDPSRERQRAALGLVHSAGLDGVIDVRGEPAPKSLPGVVASADVCLAPGRELVAGGPLPYPLLEYLACCRPVIAADVAGVSELVRDELEGLLYPPGNAAALADAVLEVLRDSSLRERLMVNGYERVRSELSTSARRRRLQEIYEALAPGSQLIDPWSESFEDTSSVELPALATESVTEAAARVPEVPRLRSRDTHPGLAMPDTEPGLEG